jgi:TPR repeat protein
MLRLGHGVAKDETRARAVLKPFAEAGEGDAMAQYGQMLMLGQGGPRDERAGRKYLEEAAKEGAPAGMYHWGELVRRDQGDAPAALWFRRAAEKDNTRAMVALGRILLWSDKVPRNVEEGTKWLQKASDGFEFEASYELARFYIADPDPKNREKGLALAQKAALSRNADHALFYADLLRGGRAGPQDFKQARLWYENAASNGNRYQRRRAQLELASLAGR